MKRLILFFILLPSLAFASVSGMDDVNVNIPADTQERLDNAITTYYQHPDVHKVETVLDIMNDSNLLRKRTSWAPMVGFLTVVFANNKEHLFDWMGRNNYNTYAEEVFVAALINANLKETASVFAQAHHWTYPQLMHIRVERSVDLKRLPIVLPGHIDTLWGAFFASGDQVYAGEIIGALLDKDLPAQEKVPQGATPETLTRENKQLAEMTLRQYAPLHKPVREALAKWIEYETNAADKKLLMRILHTADGGTEKPGVRGIIAKLPWTLILLPLLFATACALGRQRKKA